MPELRKDPVTGRWVIISTERALRPTNYKFEKERMQTDLAKCPFEVGNEKMTPPEIMSYRKSDTKKDEPGWWIRVVPNKFPALRMEGELKIRNIGLYEMMNGVGAHEVVIETPNHNEEIDSMPEKRIEKILSCWKDRMITLRKDQRFKYIFIFKNKGAQAGASLEHPHTQIIALPIIPITVAEEIRVAKAYFEDQERCLFCDIIKQEVSCKLRIIEENDDFVSFVPFAPRFPFELWIIPQKHISDYTQITKTGFSSLALILKRTLQRLNKTLNNPPFNLMVHTTPRENLNLPYYHLHIEITPQITKVAGFEWGTGFYINPTNPEDAAKYLRKVRL